MHMFRALVLSGIVCCFSAFCLADIQLADTSVAKKICSAIPTFGNQGHNDLKSLAIDPTGESISGAISITASHSWGKVLGNEISAEQTVEFDFEYDLVTNKMSGSADLGHISLLPGVPGLDQVGFDVKIDVPKVESLFSGDINTWLELIPNPAPNVLRRELENDYQKTVDEKKQLHGKDPQGIDNVWFPSSDFVDWASPDKTVGTWLVEAVITDGASLQKAMDEVKEKAKDEAGSLAAWLVKKAISGNLATDLLTGQKVVNLPNLTLRWHPIEYRSRVIVLGKPTTPWAKIMHPAFYVIYTGPGGSTNLSNDPFPQVNPPSTNPKWKLGANCSFQPGGAKVILVAPGGAAAGAGIKKDNVITAVNGTAVGMINGVVVTLDAVFATSSDGKVRLTIHDSPSSTSLHDVMVQLKQ